MGQTLGDASGKGPAKIRPLARNAAPPVFPRKKLRHTKAIPLQTAKLFFTEAEVVLPETKSLARFRVSPRALL